MKKNNYFFICTFKVFLKGSMMEAKDSHYVFQELVEVGKDEEASVVFDKWLEDRRQALISKWPARLEPTPLITLVYVVAP